MLPPVLIFLHRWLGVGLGLLFLLWFASGMVMMYWSYPSVNAADRFRAGAAARWWSMPIRASGPRSLVP